MTKLSPEKNKKIEINSHNPGSPANRYFETYIEHKYINSEKEYDLVRRDILKYYGVRVDENHLFFVNSENLNRARIHRAFSILEDPKTKQLYYADGRVSHNHLINLIIDKAKLNINLEECRQALGFLDPNGFPKIKEEIMRQASKSHQTELLVEEGEAPNNRKKVNITWVVKFDNLDKK